jgi:transcriptional regulator with XRE-family HTH domain
MFKGHNNLIYMTVFEKVKFFREKQGYSQEKLAYHLGIEQSQYSRRENGQVKFSIDEVVAISKILNLDISELVSDQTVVFNSSNQSGGSFGQYINIPESLVIQYEQRLKEKDEMISLLKNMIENLKNTTPTPNP